MTRERLYWEFLLPDEPGILPLRVDARHIHSCIARAEQRHDYSDYNTLILEDLNASDLKKKPLQDLEKLLEAKKWVVASFRGHNRAFISTLEQNGFEIKESYWLYTKENSRVFWLIPLQHPGAFLFSVNAILSVMADNPLRFKKALMRILFRMGVLKYFIYHCLVAKKVA